MDEQTIRVPCAPGSQLDFSWGHGTELQLLEIVNPDSGQGGNEPYRSSVFWNTPSPTHRALALAVAPLQAELHRSQLSGLAGGPSDALVAFCQSVRELLTKERDGGAEDTGADTVALEAALWGLLELLCLGTSRAEGYIAEDLAAWLAEHSPALDALTPPLPTSPDATPFELRQQQQLVQAGGAAEGARHRGLSERVADLLDSGRPDEREDYWPTMVHLVAVGRVGDALRLLSAHDAMQHGGSGDSSGVLMGAPSTAPPASVLPQFELLDILYVVLRQMPRFRRAAYSYTPAAAAAPHEAGARRVGGSGPTGREFDNMAEFLAYRSTWQAQCANLPAECADLFQSAQANSPRTVQGVTSVLRVLFGSEQHAVGPTVHWLEFAVAQLVHVRPNLQVAAHLRSLLQASRAARPFSPHDHVVLGLLYDILHAMSNQEGPQGVVEALSSSGAVSTWFMAHVYELLHVVPLASSMAAAPGSRRGASLPLLARPLPLSGGDQAEYWRLLLAESLMSSSSSSAWALALAYLAWCPQHGGDAADIMMEALPVDGQGGDERLVRRALRACEAHAMGPQAGVLCRVVGAAAWYAGRVGTAARWLGPSGAKDSRRLAVALQPLAASVAHALWQKPGCYEPLPLLEGSLLQDMGPLLDALSPSPSPPSSLPAPATDVSSQQPELQGLQQHSHPVLAFLVGIYRLDQAARALIEACAEGRGGEAAGTRGQQGAQARGGMAAAAQAAGVEGMRREQWGAAHALRDVLMALLGGSSSNRTAAGLGGPLAQQPSGQEGLLLLPHALVLPLMAYLVPFLEVAGGGGRLLASVFSSQDVGVLSRVLSTPLPDSAAPTPGTSGWLASLQGGWQPMPTAADAGAVGTAHSKVHPRHTQDIRLALARFAARVHVYEVQRAYSMAHQSSQSSAHAVGQTEVSAPVLVS